MEPAKPPVKDLSIAKPLARNISNDLSIDIPPFQPAAGEVYLIAWKDDCCKGNEKIAKPLARNISTL